MSSIPRHTSKGYTLIELLLYMSLLGSLLLGISLFFVTSTTARVKNQTVAEVDRQGELIMDAITRTIRNADSITSPSTGATASSLTLAVPTTSLTPTVFSSPAGTLQMTEAGGSAVALHNDKVEVLAANLSFKNLSRSGTPGVVRISFVISRKNPNNRNEYSYQKTFTGTAALRP